MLDVAEGNGDLLDPSPILRYGEITLDKRVKLIMKENSTVLFVVLEQIAHGDP